MKYLSTIIIYSLFMFFGCSERNQDQITNPTQNNNQNQIDALTYLNPIDYGDEVQTPLGSFLSAIFIEYNAQDVWAMYTVKKNEYTRLNWELDINDPLPFIMHTDKYHDNYGIGYVSVYSGVPVSGNETLINIQLSVADIDFNEDLSNEFSEYFQIVQPVVFGDTIYTSKGNFVESLFSEFDTDDIWAILKTNVNGTKQKVNLARKFNFHRNYYLIPATYTDLQGNVYNAVKVGVRIESFSSISNIEVIVQK